jgi:hypothetical protein
MMHMCAKWTYSNSQREPINITQNLNLVHLGLIKRSFDLYKNTAKFSVNIIYLNALLSLI